MCSIFNSAALVLALGLGVFLGDLAAQDANPVDRIAAAREIDRLVDSELERQGVAPRGRADDQTFVRRAYLGLLGRIPTLDETQGFLADGRADRRDRLVADLMQQPGFVSHWFNWWADLLRVRSRLARRTSGEPYIHWLKEALQTNKAYDEMVVELLTAEGAAHARGKGATGYVLRDLGMPEDNMANTVRVFLGTRLECAQCHNHPTDRWTQKEFFEMSAFAGGVAYNSRDLRDPAERQRLRGVRNEVLKKHGREGVRALGRVLRNQVVGVKGTGTGLARLPKEYQYDDAKPLAWVKAKPIFEADLDLDPEIPRERRRQRGRRGNRGRNRNPQVPQIASREVFAQWVTSPDNPRFTKVIVNRLWKQVMGRGLIEPVDDIRDDSVAVAPELMRHLEELMIDLDYDLRAFIEVLWSTKAAQRKSLHEEPSTNAAVLAGMPLRRLSAEQMWDSLLTLAIPHIDSTLAPPESSSAQRVYEEYDRLNSQDSSTVMQRVDLQMLRAKDPAAYRQALRELRANDPRMASMRDKAREMRAKMRAATRKRDLEEVARIRAEMAKARQSLGRRANRNALLRASDLPAPAPLGHFLRQFGQSDRETIDGAHVEPSVPQVLQMLNGFVEQRLLSDRTGALALAISAGEGTRERIDLAYLAILSRKPTQAERALWLAEARTLKSKVWGDLIWTLVNTHEFRFAR